MSTKENNLAAQLGRTSKNKQSNDISGETLATQLDQFDKAEQIMNKIGAAPEQKQVKDKIKYVTYAIPESFTNIVDQLIKRCMRNEVEINKSEVVRLGIQLVNELPQEQLIDMLQKVKLPKGRTKLM